MSGAISQLSASCPLKFPFTSQAKRHSKIGDIYNPNAVAVGSANHPKVLVGPYESMNLKVPPYLGANAAAVGDAAGVEADGADEAGGFGVAEAVGDEAVEHPVMIKANVNKTTRGMRNFFTNRLQIEEIISVLYPIGRSQLFQIKAKLYIIIA